MSVYGSYSYDVEGNARIGGIDVSQLATDLNPLYILDQHTIMIIANTISLICLKLP